MQEGAPEPFGAYVTSRFPVLELVEHLDIVQRTRQTDLPRREGHLIRRSNFLPIERRACARACRGVTWARSWFAPGLHCPTGPGACGVGCTVVDVRVRAGEPSDAAFIVEMARFASVMEDRPLPPADDPALVRGLPPSPDTAVLTLDHDGHPIGAAWWHFRDCPLVVTPDGAQVPELVVAVTPSYRGRGVGRCLLDALTARAAEHGYDRLALNVHICNPATRLYSRAGFVVAGKGRGPLGVAMVLQLPAILH